MSSAVGEVASVHRPRRAVPRRRRLAAIFETTKKDPKNHASRRVRPPNPMDEPPFLFFAVARFGRTVGFFSFSADGGVATPPPPRPRAVHSTLHVSAATSCSFGGAVIELGRRIQLPLTLSMSGDDDDDDADAEHRRWYVGKAATRCRRFRFR